MTQRDGLTLTGIYTIPEASRLTGVPARSIRRWALGYYYRSGPKRRFLPPVVQPELDPIDSTFALSFLDLQEIRCLHAFRKHGVSWPTLRLAWPLARTRIGHEHPFATGQFVSDGRTILSEVAQDAKDRALEDIVRSQFVFTRVIENFLRGVDFAVGQVVRWFPEPERLIVLDPRRSFGQPILTREGVPTAILAKAYRAEKSVDRVAHWYEVEVRSVRAAVAFERRLAA